MAENLKILVWNAIGLLQHKQELSTTMETRKIDICLILETHFANQMCIRIRVYPRESARTRERAGERERERASERERGGPL